MEIQGKRGQPRPSGVGKHLKWIIPLVVLAVGCSAGFAMFVANLMKSSDVYVQALAQVRENAEVIEALGKPIEDGFMPTGNIQFSGNSGSADLAISISGPKRSGKIYAKATKSAGRWKYSVLVVTVEGGGRIDLLAVKADIEED